MRPTRFANPFVMMTNPEAILAAVERSERLNGLQRHICRPLDRPLIPKTGGVMRDLEAYDRAIDGDDADDVALPQESADYAS